MIQLRRQPDRSFVSRMFALSCRFCIQRSHDSPSSDLLPRHFWSTLSPNAEHGDCPILVRRSLNLRESGRRRTAAMLRRMWSMSQQEVLGMSRRPAEAELQGRNKCRYTTPAG